MRKVLTCALAALSISIVTSGVVLAGDSEGSDPTRRNGAGTERQIEPKRTAPRPAWNRRIGPKTGRIGPRKRSIGRRTR